MNTEYAFADNQIKYTQSLPMDDIIAMANNIWSDVKKLPDDISETQYHDIYNKYREFGSSFPIILRWMIQMKKYSNKAFKRFLIKYSGTDIKSRTEYLKLQAEYLVYLYQEGEHYSKKDINNYRDFIIKQLMDEDDKMTKYIQEADVEINKIEYEKRERLYNYIKQLQQK